MHNQDFEAYADHKLFNFSISDGWDAAVREVSNRLNAAPADLIVLDYGCGDGKYFPYFINSGCKVVNVHGLEVSKARVERCHSIGFSQARLLEPDQRLPFADGSFDLVNCMEVIEHIPSQEGRRVLAELRRILRPGGVLLISTPNYPIKRFYDIYDAVIHRKWKRFWDDPTHVTKFNYSSLSDALEQSRFCSVESRLFKPGFLYKRFPDARLLHKLFFICQA